MKNQDAQFELIRRCIDRESTDREFTELEALLRDDSDFRRVYLSYLNVDSALEALPKESAPKPSTGLLRFPQWRPLATAAAAGVVLGLFCASVAWAIVLPSEPAARLVLPILTESFEKSATPLIKGFPTRTGEWGGDPAQVVGTVPKRLPIHGAAVLSLGSSPDSNLGYLQQIIDVSSLPQAEEGEMRTVEVIASFHAHETGEQERYTLRVATFNESPESVHNLWEGIPWREMDDNTLTMTKSGLTTSAEAESWQTISVAVEVPDNARSVVISLAAGRLDPLAPKTLHYLDDVRADLVISPLTKRLRPKLR